MQVMGSERSEGISQVKSSPVALPLRLGRSIMCCSVEGSEKTQCCPVMFVRRCSLFICFARLGPLRDEFVEVGYTLTPSSHRRNPTTYTSRRMRSYLRCSSVGRSFFDYNDLTTGTARYNSATNRIPAAHVPIRVSRSTQEWKGQALDRGHHLNRINQ